MDPPDQVVDSGGGAVFQGDVTAGRDVTINHITEIRQVTERLSSRFTSTDTPEKLLGSLEALSGAAEFTEDYAKELKASVFTSGFPLERVCRECASILSELKRLEALLGRDMVGDDVTIASLNGDVLDIRSRVMSLQMHLSSIISRKTAKDFQIIKEAVTQLMNSQSSSDEASSIRTFYTASAIPYVERQMWQEIQNTMCASLSTEYVRDNYGLIVAWVEKLIFDNTSSWLAHGPKPEDLPSETLKAGTADTDLRVSETFNVAKPHMEGVDIAVQEQVLGVEDDGNDDASIGPIYNRGIDPKGMKWARSVGDGSGDCLLTLDGGGVRTYSSILIVEALMEEVVAYENRFEREFTHYPRIFTASYFRPCHYFHKMYGTSTGGILAIALSRLRMTVAQTSHALPSILNEMYSSPQRVAPLAARYNHSRLETAFLRLSQAYCKQHEQGTCNHEDSFRWPSTDRDNSNEKQQMRHHSERCDPENHVCQTICLSTVTTELMEEAYLLRTYNHVYDLDNLPPWIALYNENSLDLTIPQVVRATTATPFFFRALEVEGPCGKMTFRDAGIHENNPSWCALSEASSLLGDEEEPSLLLSIGAGHTGSSSNDLSRSGIIPFGLSALSKYARRQTLFNKVLLKNVKGQNRHESMRVVARGGHTWYKRFEVTHGLEKIKTDEWERGTLLPVHDSLLKGRLGGKTLNKILVATEAYLNRREPDLGAYEYASPGVMLQHTAEKLVRMRRARELEAMTQGGKKREQWEAFMGKHLPGEREFFHKYQAEWDFALLGRKQ